MYHYGQYPTYGTSNNYNSFNNNYYGNSYNPSNYNAFNVFGNSSNAFNPYGARTTNQNTFLNFENSYNSMGVGGMFGKISNTIAQADSMINYTNSILKNKTSQSDILAQQNMTRSKQITNLRRQLYAQGYRINEVNQILINNGLISGRNLPQRTPTANQGGNSMNQMMMMMMMSQAGKGGNSNFDMSKLLALFTGGLQNNTAS